MTQRPQPRDPRSRLALGCSALARAGQQLSVASSPAEVRAALESVATQLESDPNLAGLLPVNELAQKCRETATCPDDGALVSGCRLMATSLARRATSLAAEVQQRSRTAAQPPAAATPHPARAPSQPDRHRVVAADPIPASAAPSPGAPVVSEGPATPAVPSRATSGSSPPPPRPVPGPRTAVDPARAETAPEVPVRPSSQRFSRAGLDAVTDARTNRMWLAAPLPGMKHAEATAAVAQLGAEGHRDWRLPTLAELQELLGAGGLQSLHGLGVLPGLASSRLWSSDVRSRFFGLLKSVGVVSATTGQASRCSPGDASVQALAVRSG